jgi:hypothetical protein
MKYVQPKDRANEVRAMEQVRRECLRLMPGSRWEVRQESDENCFDGSLYRDGKLFAIVEVRGRNGDPSRYSEWHTRKSKVDKLVSIARRDGVKCLLVITWNGAPYLADAVKFPPLQSHMSGRTDRNNPADWEELYLIPSNLFYRI